MIEFPKEKKSDLEIFKLSDKSICKQCTKLKDTCANKYNKWCGTDPKIGKAFVKKCTGYNLNQGKK